MSIIIEARRKMELTMTRTFDDIDYKTVDGVNGSLNIGFGRIFMSVNHRPDSGDVAQLLNQNILSLG